MPKTFVVLGNPHGGTSMISGLLVLMDVPMGRPPGDYSNEDPVLRDAPTPKLSNIIRCKNKRHDMWGWKDPLLVQRIDEVHPLLRDPHYIAVIRNPDNIVVSERRWSNGIQDAQEVKVRSKVFNNKIKTFIRDKKAILHTYKDIVTNPDEYIDELVDFTDIDVTEDKRRLMLEFMRPGSYKCLDCMKGSDTCGH